MQSRLNLEAKAKAKAFKHTVRAEGTYAVDLHLAA